MSLSGVSVSSYMSVHTFVSCAPFHVFVDKCVKRCPFVRSSRHTFIHMSTFVFNYVVGDHSSFQHTIIHSFTGAYSFIHSVMPIHSFMHSFTHSPTLLYLMLFLQTCMSLRSTFEESLRKAFGNTVPCPRRRPHV